MIFGRLAGLAVGTLVLVASARIVGDGAMETPRTVVRSALRAVEGDSVSRVAAIWKARVARNSEDRIAALGLATLARLTYDYDGAAKQYQILSAGPRRDRVTTYALLGLAWQADTRGMIAHADTMFVRARASARADNDKIAEAEAMLGWAFERGPIDGAPVAVAIIDSAAKLIPDSVTDLRAEYWVRRAVLSAVLSKASVDREAEQGRQFAKQAGIRRLEAKAMGASALNRLLHGKAETAIMMYDTVARVQREAHDFSALAETLYRQGDAMRSRGDLGAFKQNALQAAEEAKRSRNDIVGRSVLLGLGALSLLVHDYVSADQYLAQAVERQTADGVIAELMLSRAHRAKLYFAIGDIEKARAETRAVIEYHRSTGDGAYEFTSLRDLIAIELRAKHLDEAERVLREAEALTRKLQVDDWNQDLSEDRGSVALVRGDLKMAEREFVTALALLDTSRHVARHSIRARMAEVAALRGDLATAESELFNADMELDRWRASLPDRELRTLAFQASATEQSTRGQSVATTIAALARGGRAAGALQLAERRRARELIDRVLQARALVETGRVDRDVPGQLTAGVFADSRSDDGKGAIGNTAEARTAPDVIPNPMAAQALLVAIPDRHTALLEYVTGTLDAPTTVFVVTRGVDNQPEVHASVLPSADSLTPSIERFVGLIEAGEDPTVLANELGETLLAPVMRILNMRQAQTNPADSVTRLIIVPDGPLHNIPFDALRLPDGKFVVERFVTSLAPSNAMIAALRERGLARADVVARRPVRMLVFGDPVFAEAASRQDTDTASTFDALPRLAGSAEEAELVARYADSSNVRLRRDASATYLKTTPLQAFRILHFATHALVNKRTAARTALALAPSEGESGFVSPGELAALSLDADLVVLSACQTAGGVVIDGEGVQGLTSSFLEAGAQSVVASQWRIGDQSTVQVVRAFYDALARRLPVAEALQVAKLAALRHGMPARDWAAFTVIGDPSVQVPLTAPPARLISPRLALLGGIILAGLLGAGFFVLRYRRRR